MRFTEVWLSLVERFVRDEEAVGSSPVTSTNTHNHFLIVSIFIATLKNPKLILITN